MTRDEKIEALIDAVVDDAAVLESKVQKLRDRYRAARQPAPETPTPTTLDVEKLAEEIADAVGLPCDAARSIIARKIRQHAATLKERKEKADGA